METSPTTDLIPTDPEIQRVAAALSAWFQSRLNAVVSLGETLCGELQLTESGTVAVSDRDRRRLKDHSFKYLAEEPVADGCGLIFALAALDSGRGQLEWWVREGETRFARYSFGVVPGSDRFYDYEQLDWFTKSFVEAKPAFVGPYIDYLGVETYVVTLTAPARVNGELVGAAGNDIQVSDLEHAIMPTLHTSQRELAVLNEHGNVVASNTSRYLVGELIHPFPDTWRQTALEPEVFGLKLAYSVEPFEETPL